MVLTRKFVQLPIHHLMRPSHGLESMVEVPSWQKLMLNRRSGYCQYIPQSFHLLGCCCQNSYFVDRCLPMGCSISCALFEAFSSFFEWAFREVAGVNSVIHYLDDFLCIGPPESRCCGVLQGTLQYLAEWFGIPLAADKTEAPTSELVFVGITIDSVAM